MGDRRSIDFLGEGVRLWHPRRFGARLLDANIARMAALDATTQLAVRAPTASARDTRDAKALAIIYAAVASALVMLPWLSNQVWLSLVSGGLLLFVALVRLGLGIAAVVQPRFASQPSIATPMLQGDLPVYTVLVALHREASVASQLVEAIQALDWPSDRLDVVFVIEQNDTATRQALIDACDGFSCRIMSLPPIGPLTKPKALQAAMSIVRGPYVCVFDAEDRPDPHQLKAAYRAFIDEGPRLGCVQAPLVTWNDHESWIAAQFAIDYAVWFRLVLPGLARLGSFLPLGGTSNHFRVEALRAVGGWDPYNVTEDADLGLRLARYGWKLSTIAPRTLEEAPPHFANWVRQRSRWIQGHLITLAVHLRQPRNLLPRLGIAGMIGLVIAILVGPLAALIRFPMAIGLLLALWFGLADQAALQMAGAGLGVEFVLATLAIMRDRRHRLFLGIVTMPAYHMAQSLPACLAIHTILTRPHYWQKTDHGADARGGRILKSLTGRPQIAG